MLGAMPTLVVGMSCFPAFPYMPTTSVGMAPNFPQQERITDWQRGFHCNRPNRYPYLPLLSPSSATCPIFLFRRGRVTAPADYGT